MSKVRLYLVKLIRTKNFIIFLLYCGIATIVIPYEGKKLPYSIFYDSTPKQDHLKVLGDNAKRLHEAERTLTEISCSGKCLEERNRATQLPEFCFVITSVSRPASVKYLTQVVASLLSQISDTNSVFMVYNAEGRSHEEATNLSAIIPVESYTGESAIGSYAKEKADYVHALEWCEKKRARISVILEDDALPPKDFIERLKFILEYRMSRNNKKWAFLKLYYPEKWQGWANEEKIILELLLSSILGGFILTLVTFCLQFIILRTLPSIQCLIDPGTIIRFVFSSILVVYMLMTLGRPHWLALRSINIHLSSVVPAPGCCTPAVVFPRAHITDLVEHLKKAKCSVAFPLDLAMDEFANNNGLDRLLAVPNLVKHIGFVSSLPGKGWKNPQEFRIK